MIFSYLLNMQSHPSWVCGLKHQAKSLLVSLLGVTPFVGVWIETYYYLLVLSDAKVTPFVGVWIETINEAAEMVANGGHTLRGCVD